MHRRIVAAAALAAVYVAVPAFAADLEGAEWVLEEIAGGGVHKDVRSTLQVEGESAFGSGGCNRFNAGATVAGDTLKLGLAATTQMMCPPEAMDQEQRYLKALAEVARFEVTEEALVLTGPDGEPRLRFSRTAAP